MNFFKLFVLALTLLVAFSAQAQDKIKLGVSLPLTGTAATYGSDMKNALIFANKELAQDRYQLIFEDDACSAKGAVTVASKLVNVEKVKYMLGVACSAAMLASAKIYSQAQVLQITSSASAASIAKLGPWTFRTFPSDQFAADELYKLIASRHKTVGIISEETDYTQAFVNSLNQANEGQGMELLNENTPPGNTDFRSVILRLRAKNVDALIINTQLDSAFLDVLKQVQELQFDKPIYGIYWPGSKLILDQASQLLEGIEFVDIPGAEDVLTDAGKKLYDKYVAEYGVPNTLPLLIATTVESMRALDQALQSKEPLQEYLSKTKFEGMFGRWHFDSDGEIVGLKPVLKVIKDGKPQLLKTKF